MSQFVDGKCLHCDFNESEATCTCADPCPVDDAFGRYVCCVDALRVARESLFDEEHYDRCYVAETALNDANRAADRAARNIALALSWCAVRKAAERQTELRFACELRLLVCRARFAAVGDFAMRIERSLFDLIEHLENQS